jgi:hypothetical protein
MAFFSHALSPSDTSLAPASRTRPSLFARFLAAMIESRQRQAEREIARYVSLNGGKLTDDMERGIERILAGTSRDGGLR